MHALVDRSRDLPEGDLAQGPEVGGGEEVEQGRLDPLGRVDLARAKARLERLGGEVHEHDLVGVEQDGVGDRLAHPHLGQLVDAVVEALQVLDVDRRDHVDPGQEQVLDVGVALRMGGAGGVRVRELVHERHLRPSRDDGGSVHLAQRDPAVDDLAGRDHLEPLRHGGGLGAPVGLEPGDDDVLPLGEELVPLLQHRVGLADPGRHADVHLQPAPPDHLSHDQPPYATSPADVLEWEGRSRGQAPKRLWMIRSMSLMPMNGAITPPRP